MVRARTKDTVININTRSVVPRQRQITTYFPRRKPRFLVPGAALIAGGAATANLARRWLNSETNQDPNPKPKKRRMPKSKSLVKKRLKLTHLGYGSYAGRFKKPAPFSYVGGGVSLHARYGGAETAAAAGDPVFLGANAFAADHYLKRVLLAILRAMLLKSKFEMTSAYQKIDHSLNALGGSAGSLHYRYRVNATNIQSERSIQFTADQTWIDFCDTWVTDIQSALGTVTKDFELLYVFVYPKDALGNSIYMPNLWIDLKNASIYYEMNSKLTLQNRTGASTPTDDSTTVNDVNPLTGKLYIFNHNRIDMRYDQSLTSLASGKAGTTNGIILWRPAAWSTDNGQKNFLTIPDPKVFNKVKHVSNIFLDPGQVKTNRIKFSGKMKLQKFIHYFMLQELAGAQYDLLTTMGKTQFFAFEKAVKTGAGTAVASVGWEHDMDWRFQIFTKQERGFIADHVV